MAKAKKGKLTIEDALVPVEEQPYEVPENWCWTKINSVASVYTGNSINERIKAEKYEGQQSGLLFIATKDVDFDNSINYETNVRITDPENFKKAPANTALLCIEGGSAGRKIGFTNQEVCFGNKLCAFASDKIEPKYIYYFLQSNAFIYQFNDKKHGLIGGVSVKDLCEIGIALPPLAEQKRIVEQIEKLFSKLDEAKDKVQQTIDSYDDRRASILHEAFNGELTKEWRKNNSIDICSWKNTTISGIAELVTKGASPRWQGVEYLDDDTQTLFVTSENVREGYLDLTKEKYLDNKINDIQKRSVLKKGDVLVNIVGASIGRSAIYNIDKLANTNQAVCLIRLNDIELNQYVCFYLNSPVALRYYSDNKSETARANLSLADINNLPINIPSKLEANEIMKVVDAILDKEKRVLDSALLTLEQIDLMKKSILAKAFRGELGTNIADEENAIELLKSILA